MVENQTTSIEVLERATPLERLVSLFRIPYFLGSFLISSIVGPPGAIILCYSQTGDIKLAFSKAVWLFVGLEMRVLPGLFSILLIFSILFYCTYIVRFMRLKLISVEEQLLPILPDEASFDNTFKSVTSLRYPLLLGAIIIATANLETSGNFSGFGSAQIDLIYFAVCLLFWSIIAGQFVWVYLSSILGLYNLGKSDLRLKSYQEDNMLGAKPIGSLSLVLARTYLTLLGSFVFLATLLPEQRDPVFVALIATLIMIGVAVFFLPLVTTHRRMLEARTRELRRIDKNLLEATERLNNQNRDDFDENLIEINKTLAQLTTTIKIDIQRHARDDVKEWPTWPIDTQILRRFGAMIIAITCTIVANIIIRSLLYIQ